MARGSGYLSVPRGDYGLPNWGKLRSTLGRGLASNVGGFSLVAQAVHQDARPEVVMTVFCLLRAAAELLIDRNGPKLFHTFFILGHFSERDQCESDSLSR